VIENSGDCHASPRFGRDHRPWYDRQRPPLFAAALRAAKKTLDPQGLLNPSSAYLLNRRRSPNRWDSPS
jgi:alkyldihydroxyacetonephosphate synthase